MIDDTVWTDRVVCVLGELSSLYVKITEQAVLRVVAARYAARFEPDARLYYADEPRWHHRVREALDALTAAGLVDGMRLTEEGRRRSAAACERSRRAPERAAAGPPAAGPGADLLVAGVLTPPLRDRFARSDSETRARQQIPIMIELNLRFRTGPRGAMARVAELWRFLDADSPPRPLSDEYAVGDLTANQIEGLISADSVSSDWNDRAVYRIWPDFEVKPQIDSSSATIKATAARRSFNSFGDGIVWAVIDSGIQGAHPHFAGHHTLDDPSVADLHRDFTGHGNPLVDESGHGTHVAGIIAGGLDLWGGPADRVLVTEQRFNVGEPGMPIVKPRPVHDPAELAGVAPHAKLVSLKVLGGGGDLVARTTRVIEAMAYVRQLNTATSKLARVHGVNLSLGYEFDPEWFACGHSPLCLEVDKLVRSGVVVVVASGNSAYVTLDTVMSEVKKSSTAMTINDPGNAERAITVGSTHKDAPHTYGISYFSSRGPTADGRAKPDLVAPGERIASAAAGAMLLPVTRTLERDGRSAEGMAVYVEDSGTSMAAPHVSGAVAAFLSVQREFIGEPEAVKRIFIDSATSLGRDRAFQGGGLLDLMRALQSV
ncbi:S8 family peptidase [Nocardia arizonensis]|uniref:S8 family peptidase n=1 Tax=Nocardia arizonensis TaxID=1141647 RepID=UPI0006CFD586|nr:S8 family peptidase [Nocardia arizonensis]